MAIHLPKHSQGVVGELQLEIEYLALTVRCVCPVACGDALVLGAGGVILGIGLFDIESYAS